MLPVVVIVAIIAIVVMVVGSIILWLIGLIIPFAFFAIGIMLLYALHEMEVLDVKEDKWLLAVPIAMFFVGLGFDTVGVLTFQPLSWSTLIPFTLTFETMLLLLILILLIVDIVASKLG